MNINRTTLAVAVAATVVLIFPLVVHVPYYIHTMFMFFLFATMGLAWNLIGGYGAQLSLGHSAFFAIGAYTSVLLAGDFNITPWVGGGVGMVLACLAAIIIGVPCFRLRGPYFALATIAAAEIIRILLLHFQHLTGGANGIPLPFHGANFLFLQFATEGPYYYLALLLLVVVFAIVHRMKKQKIGRYLAAVREDQDAAESLGVRSDRVKLTAFVVSAAITAACGVFYAFSVGYIDPDSVASVNLSVEIAVVVIVGGINTLWGPVLGASVVIALTELTNMFLGSFHGAGLVLYGLLLIVVVLAKPAGLISFFDYRKAKPLPKKASASVTVT